MTRFTLLVALCFTVPATAGLVSRDLFEPGDGLLIYDEVNQREWLQPAATNRIRSTHEDLLADLADDGIYSGFQVATVADVRSLAESASAPWSNDIASAISGQVYSPPGLSSLFDSNLQLSGSIFGTLRYTYGLIVTESTQGITQPVFDGTSVYALHQASEVAVPGELNRPSSIQPGIVFLTADTPHRPSGTGDPLLAYWLYREAAPIPEPTAVALAMAACLGALRLRAFA